MSLIGEPKNGKHPRDLKCQNGQKIGGFWVNGIITDYVWHVAKGVEEFCPQMDAD